MRLHVVFRVVMCVALVGTVGCSDETLEEFFAEIGSPSTQAKRTESSTDSNEPTSGPITKASDETASTSVSQRKDGRSGSGRARQQASKPRSPSTPRTPSTTISPEAATHPLVAENAPAIDLPLLGGGQFELSSYRSKSIVVLDFWATWREPCVRELPVLAEIADEYRDEGVAFFAINDGEDRETIRWFLKEHDLDIAVPLDADRKLMDVYQAEDIPMLVVIDDQGVVQRVHTGYSSSIQHDLRAELDALLLGRGLAQEAKMIQQAGGAVATKEHKPETFRLQLASGRRIDIGEIFEAQGAAFEDRMKDQVKKRKTINSFYTGGKPFMRISRRGGSLHGPTASYYKNGQPMVYVSYSKGDRNQTLFSWDDQSRPLVFEQYQLGKRHGLRALFRACSDECVRGHIWLVQEWADDTLKETHLVRSGGGPVTFDGVDGKYSPDHEDLAFAVREFDDFEDKIGPNEELLKKSVEEFARVQRRISKARKAEARARRRAQAQYQFTSRVRTSGGIGSLRVGGVSRGRS